MSWTTFTQIMIILLTVGFFILAMIDMRYEKTPRHLEPLRKPLVYHGGSNPKLADLVDGDIRIHPETGATKLWSSAVNDWVDPIIKLKKD